MTRATRPPAVKKFSYNLRFLLLALFTIGVFLYLNTKVSLNVLIVYYDKTYESYELNYVCGWPMDIVRIKFGGGFGKKGSAIRSLEEAERDMEIPRLNSLLVDQDFSEHIVYKSAMANAIFLAFILTVLYKVHDYLNKKFMS